MEGPVISKTKRSPDLADLLRAGPSTSRAKLSPEWARPPLVSIVVTNYNYGRYVRAAIDSVKAQSYPRIECVVVDDCSNDGSFEVIASHLRSLSDDRFRCIRLEKNLGQMGAIKAGLENISGPFVTFLDADDILLPDFVNQHVAAHLNGSFSAGLTASDTFQIDEEGQLLESTFHTLVKHRSLDAGGAIQAIRPDAQAVVEKDEIIVHRPASPPIYYVDRKRAGWFIVAMSSCMFRRDLLDAIIPETTEDHRICADYYLAGYAHLIAGTITIWSQHSCYRLHKKNNHGKNSVFGGPYSPGLLAPGAPGRLDREISRHVIRNIDRLAPVIGMNRCVQLILRSYLPSSMYEAARHSRMLRSVVRTLIACLGRSR
jgi:glycosyltransferase involved in cell wall biosynthesis